MGKEFYTKIAGVQARNENGEPIQRLLKDLKDSSPEGTYLLLEHETDNEHDPNAIKVYCHGDHIGYIKRELAAEIVDMVDEDKVEAEISEITGGGDGKSYGCNILIRILDGTEPYQPPVASFRTGSTSSVHIPDPRIKKLKENVLLFPLTVALAGLFALMAATFFFVIHSIPYGIGTLIGAGLCALWALHCSDAVDQLEEMGEAETAAKAKKTGIKLAVLLLAFCVVFSFAYVGVSRYIDDQRAKDRAADWDRRAISTATVALDLYAPDVDYGPLSTEGWTVIHNQDGTTTVWAPRAYGRIALMMTDDGESYTPYWISVNDTVVLDLGNS